MDKRKKIKLQGLALAIILGVWFLIFWVYTYYTAYIAHPSSFFPEVHPPWFEIISSNLIVYIVFVLIVYWFVRRELKKLE